MWLRLSLNSLIPSDEVTDDCHHTLVLKNLFQLFSGQSLTLQTGLNCWSCGRVLSGVCECILATPTSTMNKAQGKCCGVHSPLPEASEWDLEELDMQTST